MIEQTITRFLHSRYAVIAMAALMVAAVAYAVLNLHVGASMVNKSIALPPANTWITQPLWSMAVSMLCCFATAAVAIYIIKTYNLLRSLTMLPATIFLAMLTATPSVVCALGTGIVLALSMVLAMAFLFAMYDYGNAAARPVFLVFALMSAGVATQYAYAFMLPVLFIAMVQLRIFTLRTLLAAIMGLVTPWWIMLGLGLVSPEQIHLPAMHSIFNGVSGHATALLLGTVTITAFISVAAWVMSLMRTLSYNGRTRARLGVISLTNLFVVIAMCVDYTNLTCYVPLLDMCAAIQVGHLFAINRATRTYIAIILTICLYLLLYLCRIFL